MQSNRALARIGSLVAVAEALLLEIWSQTSIGESGENSEILQTIISLAKSLKKKVVAEGIETEAQLTLLQNLGCDYGQGYLLSKPQTREKTEKALYERKSWLPVEIPDGIADAPAHAEVEENLPVF